MNISTIFSLLFCAFFAFGGGASAAPFETDFYGTWRGSIQRIDPKLQQNALPDLSALPDSLELAIKISKDETRVFIRPEGAWREIKPGSFGAAIHKTNAIVAAIDSAITPNGSAGWVGTWNLTLTTRDSDSIYAYWVRAVNNPQLPDGSDPSARFFMSGFGVLERSGPVVGADAIQASVSAEAEECRSLGFFCENGREHSSDTPKINKKIEQQR